MEFYNKNKDNKYRPEKIIGQVAFGIIYKVVEIKTNKFYALKFITIAKKSKEKEIIKQEFDNELNVMKAMNITKNKYIIELKDNFFDEKNNGYCIVMELCDGNLNDILNKNESGLPLNIIKKIFIQLNEVLKTMTNKEIIHRDLKPENILIKYTDTNKNDFDIKLTDFGFSSDNIKSSIQVHTIAGTEKYMAPEVDVGEYNKKCDLWSLGIILYELYTNKYIFDSGDINKTKINREKGNIVKETDNDEINKLIRKLIQVNIDKRIGWKEYFNDDFFKIKEEKDKNEESELNRNFFVK